MKKSRFLSLFLVVCILTALCTFCAGAYESEIVESMSVEAEAALLVDMDTDLIMYEQNAYDKVYPASITKVMTAILVMDAIDAGELSMDDVITADESTWEGLDYSSSNQNIQVGEQMSVEDLLYCLLVASAGEAGNVLAVAVSGSVDAFVEEMNSKAEELGCTGTHFVNTHGMPDDDHYTTAYDIYLMAKYAMQFEAFRTIVSTTEHYVEATNMTDTQRHFYNTNGLLSNMKYTGYYYEYCIGIKTGSTDAAGYCLLSAAEKDGQTLICVVMGCENPTDASGNVSRLQFSESSRLLQWGYSNYSVHTILDATDPVAEVTVTLASDCDYVSVVVDGTLEAQLPNDITSDNFDWTIDLPESVEAPVEAGQVLGTLTVTLDGEEYGTVDLVAVNDVERSELLAFKERLTEIVTSWQFKAVVILVLLLIVALIILRQAIRSHRRRYKGRRGNNGNYRGRR